MPVTVLFASAVASPVGTLTLLASVRGLRAVLWENEDPGRVRLGARTEAPDHPILRQTEKALAEYFVGRRFVFDMPLDVVGTDFQQTVWAALRRIPYGETRSYADLARAIGRPATARAVGAANGRNPLSIVIPCHRLIGTNGALTGFAGGLAAKRFLLALEEGVDARRPHAF